MQNSGCDSWNMREISERELREELEIIAADLERAHSCSSNFDDLHSEIRISIS